MPEQKSLPKPELDLPLPEKELESGEEKPEAINPPNNTEQESNFSKAVNTSLEKIDKPKRRFHFLEFLIIGFLIAVTVIAISLIILNHKVNVENTQTVKTKISTLSLTLDPNNISSWKTYNDTEDGDGKYSISYPPNWFFKGGASTDTSTCSGMSDIENYTDIPNKISQKGHTLISICYYWDGYKNNATNNTIKQAKVNGYPAKLVQSQSTDGTVDVYIFDYPGGGNYVIRKYYGDETMFNKILSTFKFTDSNSLSQTNNSNWKTYENNNYGFSFNYPSSWKVSKPEVDYDRALAYINSSPPPSGFSEWLPYMFINKDDELPSDATLQKINGKDVYVSYDQPAQFPTASFSIKSPNNYYITLSFQEFKKGESFQSEMGKIITEAISSFKFNQ